MPEVALLSSPGFDAGPALAALAQHAAQEHPASFAWDGGAATAHALGWQLRGDELLPLPGFASPWHDQIGACLHALHVRMAAAGAAEPGLR